jgi:hypothetical protein
MPPDVLALETPQAKSSIHHEPQKVLQYPKQDKKRQDTHLDDQPERCQAQSIRDVHHNKHKQDQEKMVSRHRLGTEKKCASSDSQSAT